MGRKRKKGSLGMQWFTTGVSTTLVLVLLGLVSFFILFARELSDSVKENLTVTVLVSDEADAGEIARLRTEWTGEPYVCGIGYVSKEQALREAAEAMGSDPSEFLGANPFRASLELRMDAAYANTDSLARVVERLKRCPLVEDVVYQKDLVDAVNENLRNISYVLLALAALLVLVSFALIAGTVRLGVYSGRFVIRTMKLAGASWGFIRRPFMARGFRLGLVSGVAADGLLAAGAYALSCHDPSLAAYIKPGMLAGVGAVVLVAGLLLTLGCTYFCVGKYLRMKACDLY